MAAINNVSKSELPKDLRLDPEFYRPFYRELLSQLMSAGSRDISSFNPIIARGKLPRYVEDGTVRVIKSAKVQSGFIDEADEFTDLQFISDSPDSEVKYGDILVNSTGRGTLGRSSIFTKSDYKYVIDGHVAKISDLTGISKLYLSIFLSSKFGFIQLDTMARGSSGQTEIYPGDIGNVLVPILSDDVVKKINLACEELYQQLENTKNLYREAEQELLKKIRLNTMDTRHVLNYSTESNDLIENQRMDPEFYQPKFVNLIRHLRANGSIKLKDFCPLPKRGVSPVYVPDGEIAIVNSQHLGATGSIDMENLDKTNIDFYSEQKNIAARLQIYDVLVYATGAYIGRSNCWLEHKKAIAGVDVIIIKPDQNVCNSVYLALFLNSQVGTMQAFQKATGSAQRHLYPSDLMEFHIFIPKNDVGLPDIEWQKGLAEKVIISNNAKRVAKQKIQETKELIEKEIEKLIINSSKERRKIILDKIG